MFNPLKSIKNLLQRQQKVAVPYHKEALLREDGFSYAFNKWSNSEQKQELIALAKDEFQLFFEDRKDEKTDKVFRFFRMDASFGFVLLERNFKDQLSFIAELIKDRLEEHEYYLYLGDKRVWVKETHTEQIERYYLKPRTAFENEKKIQHFGNVTIEHFYRDEQSTHLRLLLNAYHDHNFTTAKSPEEFVEYIFTV